MVSIYGHLSKISPDVKPGGYVRVGQVIGNVGSTGLSTGPHLHFAMEKDGAWVDPSFTEKLGENHEVSPRMKAIFDDIKDRYQSALAELPDLQQPFDRATDARKPAISKFGDMYHVTIGRHPGQRPGISATDESRAAGTIRRAEPRSPTARFESSERTKARARPAPAHPQIALTPVDDARVPFAPFTLAAFRAVWLEVTG